MPTRIKENNLSSNTNTNDFSAEFDKISDDFKKNGSATQLPEEIKLSPLQQRRKTRSQKLAEQKSANLKSIIADKLITAVNGLANIVDIVKSKVKKIGDSSDIGEEMETTKSTKKKKKKYRISFKRLLLSLLCLFLTLGVIGFAFAFMIIKDAVQIDPNNIYTLLSEDSILYDKNGDVLDSIFNSPDGKRTNIAYSDIPKDLRNAVVAIEDKTFWDHHGFNIIRMFGAVKDSLFGGGKISGTSTITQQLARNLYLTDTKSSYSFKRKILEAYYSIVIEKHLTKEQILEAYLNTISLGFGSSGVQAASQAYFSKDVGALNLTECVALAAIPQSPTNFALVKTYANDDVTESNENILYRGNTYTYIYNGEVSKDRRNLILRFMNEQNYITQSQYQEALVDDLRDYIKPTRGNATEYSSYFTDYAIEQVLKDLIDSGYSEENARYQLYNGGLRIYTTIDRKIQQVVEKEFANNANFPKVTNLKYNNGNIIGNNGNVLLYSYNNYFDENGTFTLTPDEYKNVSDGSLLVYEGRRLSFYKTEVQGKTDYSVEFKNMFRNVDNTFYSIGGGFISIPQEYKNKDRDGNLIISAQFFRDYPDFFTSSASGLSISSKNYALKQSVVQPQSAIVITDFKTGEIKAMAGGRNTVGRLLFNRADKPRQPGSSIKPMAVYAPALQSGVDTMNGGSTQSFASSEMFGKYLTAGSVINDAPLTIQGKTWPKNWYPGYRGLQSLRKSVEQSVNVNAVKVFMEIGADYSARFLEKFGVTTLVKSGSVNDMNAAALALGGMTHGVSPLQMTGGYGTFGNQGTYVEPISYTKVTDKRGGIILEKIPRTNEVMDKGVAFIMTDILRTTVTAGIAGNAAIGIQPVAGKTGTTSDNFDAWFVGLTPQYSAALWIGNDVNIELSQGSPAAAKLWSKIMKQVCTGLPLGSFPPAPSNVISVAIDTKSGLLPSSVSALDSGAVRTEYFVKGTEPTQVDNVHTYVKICKDTGFLATPLCENAETAFGVQTSSSASELPHTYCYLHNPDPSMYPINESAQGNGQPQNPHEDAGAQGSENNENTDFNQWGPWGPDSAPDSQPTQTSPGAEEGMPEWLRQR